MTRRQANKFRRPFTLVELVVAMAVMLMVAMIIGTASTAFYHSYQRTLRHTDRLKEYMAIDRMWDTGVRNMVPFQWRDSEDEVRFVFEGEPDTMLFATLRRAYGNDPGALMFVRLRLDEEGSLVADYSFYPRTQWDEEGEDNREMTTEVLATKVAAIHFQYAEVSDGEDDAFEWFETWEEEEHAAIPLAVRLTVEWEDGTTEYWLRRVAGVSGKSTLGIRETVSGDSSDSGTSGGTSQSGSSSGSRSSSSGARSSSQSGSRSSSSSGSRSSSGGGSR